MIRLEGDTLPIEARGAIPPILFGDLLRDVPGIPLQVGWVATLADNCGIDPSVTTLKLGGADLADVLEAVPAAGVVQLENEWLRYSAILSGPPRLVIAERGYRETEPAAHAKGSSVYFVETRPLYAFAYAPPGCSYPPDALVQLRVNDNAETPPATVRLQDERPIPGVRLVTVEFDASRAFYTPPPPALPSHAVLLGPAGGADGDGALRTGAGGTAIALRTGTGGPGHLMGFGGTVTGRSLPAGARDPRQRVLLPPAPTMRPSLAPAAAPFAGNGGQRTITLRSGGALGHVTADLRGLRDTAAGRYSGVALGPLVQPAAIVRLLLEESYGETDPARYHAPTWTATAARHAERRFTWRLVWRGEAFEAFRAAVQVCGQADLYLDDEGRWRYAFRDPLGLTVGTITERELLDDPALAWSGGRDVITELEIAWGEGVQGGTLTLESPAMITRHGRNHGGVALPYVATAAMARQIGRYLLARRDRPRQTLTLRASHAWLGLAVTDRVFVATPLLELYGAKRVPFEIVGITDRGDERVLALLEGDPLTRELRLAGTLATGGVLTLQLAGTLEAGEAARVLALTGTLLATRTTSRLLAGTLVIPRSFSRALAGTLAAAEAGLLTKTLTGTLIAGRTTSRPLAGTLATPRALSKTLAGTILRPSSLSRPLQGTLLTARAPSVPLAGTLDVPVTGGQWDAAGATWDAAGAKWDTGATTMSVGVLENKTLLSNGTGPVASANAPFLKSVRKGSLLVVAGGVWHATGAPSITVTDTLGTVYTVRTTTLLASVSGQARGFLAWGIAPASGANTANVAAGIGSAYINPVNAEAFGAAASPVDVEATPTSGTSTTPSIALTTLTADAVIFGLLLPATISATNIAQTPTAPSVQLMEDEQPAICPYSFVLQYAGAAGAQTLAWTLGTSREWRVLAVAFKPG